ncbi:uncharacterized protein LOC144914793 [Branchiostoma floridae x Branchiostoma belcheri]
MTQETVNRHRYNLRSLGPIEASDIMFRGYRAGNSILVHYTIPRESTAVLRLMATYSDPRLVFMGVTSLQIDAEPPIRVIQEELFNDIKRQRTVDDFEVGCGTRTKQKRAPRNWTRLSALNLFSDALPLHLQVAASLKYQGFSYSLVQGLMQKDQLREQEKSQLIQKAQKAEVDSKTIMTLRSKLNISENMLKEALEANAVLRSKLNISENMLKEALEANAVLEKKLQQAREFAEKAAKQVTSHVTEYRGEKATRTTGDFRPDKITYGGLGSEPGKFVSPYGVVVSSSNEIFVTDGGNRRVQVHTTEGVYLRHFPTVVPGTEDKDMWPHGVSMDGNGKLWVVGKGESADYVVQYSTDGTAMTQFHLQKISEYRVIAVDMRNNHIMVTDADRGEVEVFRPDGSLVRRFGHPEGGMRRPRHITVDGEGNILVSDWFTHSVYMYDESGKFLLKFGGEGSGEGQLQYPNGICTDSSSGHIIVADFENQRVQMFTRHGDYIRSFVTGLWAEGVAVGPEGQLVVTEYDNDSVTIFPSCR